MKSRFSLWFRASGLLFAAAACATSATADTSLPVGQTIIDTTGNPTLGLITRSTGATAWFNAAGTATATGTPLVNGILGPWATIGTGSGTRYATLDGSNNVVAYTGAIPATTFAWTSSNPATNNYDVAGTTTALGNSRTANTVRYTGAAATQNIGSTTLTLNGLMNAGSGTLTLGFTGSGSGRGIVIGSTQELALNAASAGITISAPIYDNIAGASAVVINGSGGNVVTLSGTGSFTGGTYVNSGTLSLSGPVLSQASPVFIGTGVIVNLNFTGINTVYSLEIAGSGPLPGGFYNASHPTYGSYFTGSGSLLVVPEYDQNGTWISTANGSWEIAGNWQDNLVAAGYDRTATFSAGTGSESITVSLDAPRTIGNLAFSNANYTISGPAALTLDASATPLIGVETGHSAVMGVPIDGVNGFEKTAGGNLTLSAANTYSGDTIVSEGSLTLSGSGTLSTGDIDIAAGATLNSNKSSTLNNTILGEGSIFNNAGTLTLAGDSSSFSGNFTHNTTSSSVFDSTAALSANASYNVATTQSSGGGIVLNILNGSNILEMGALSGVANSLVRNGLNVVGANTLRIGNLNTDTEFAGTLGGGGGTLALEKVGNGILTLSGPNTYTGSSTVTAGTLAVSSTGSLRFRPATNGTTNAVTGTSSATLSFLGTVSLNLSAADTTIGNSWNLFNLGSFSGPPPTLTPAAVTTTTLGSFTEVTPGVWELPVTGAKWVFTEATGTLAYTTAATDYDTWKSNNGVTGGNADDDDNDGVTNFEEYAFGLDPTGGASVNPITVPLNKATGKLSYARRTQSLTNLTYTVWYSTDLAGWTEDTGALQSASAPVADVETVEVTLTPALLTNPKLFIQVRAE